MGKRKVDLSFADITVEGYRIGDGYCIHVSGGENPHIGCVVLAMPRLSLRNPDAVSATSSVLNVTGHKDEYICRQLAEAVAKRKNTITVCTGGFHVDGITAEQIQELMECINRLAEGELEWLI